MNYENTMKPRSYASDIPVYCAYDEIVAVDKLKPNPRNPNKHPKEQVKLLGKIIRGNGWRNPITVSAQSGLIVKGHGRLLAAQLEELEEVPVEYQSYDCEEAELADLTADNRIAELSQTDNKMLADIFADIDTGTIDFELSGYSEDEYLELASALSEAIHTDNEIEDTADSDITEAVEDQGEDRITRYGDTWVLGAEEQLTLEVNSYATERMIPKLVDEIVRLYVKVTGDRCVKCIRGGEEMPNEDISDIFKS